jgi:hypothetical protein
VKKISIIALGWLGEKLYDHLELNGHDVLGTYNTKKRNKNNQIQFNFKDKIVPNEIILSEIIIFNLTPSSINHIDLFQSFIAKTAAKIIFVSSTSVYGQLGVVNEDDIPLPKTSNGKLLLECEKVLLERGNSVIIRPGGLYGGERHPGNFLSGKKEIRDPNAHINLTSRDDLINIIDKVLLSPSPRVINAVNTNHPIKSEYYIQYCEKNDLAHPSFLISEEEEKNKTVNTKFKDFRVSSPLP